MSFIFYYVKDRKEVLIMNNPIDMLSQMMLQRCNPQSIIQQMLNNNPNAEALMEQLKQSGQSPKDFAIQYAQQNGKDIYSVLNTLSRFGVRLR
jgi:hypothetical protein